MKFRLTYRNIANTSFETPIFRRHFSKVSWSSKVKRWRNIAIFRQNSVRNSANFASILLHFVYYIYWIDLFTRQGFEIIGRLEQFSIECRKTKTKPITHQLEYLANLKPKENGFNFNGVSKEIRQYTLVLHWFYYGLRLAE